MSCNYYLGKCLFINGKKDDCKGCLVKKAYNKGVRDTNKDCKIPQGKWRLTLTGDVICSVCKLPRRDTRIDHIQFCNHCGARMITASEAEHEQQE